MANFANYVTNNLHGINQYEDIFNTITQARKIMMDPTGNPQQENLAAAHSVAGSLLDSGWNQGNNGILIRNLSEQTITDIQEYILDEDPSETTEITMRQLKNYIQNYIDNNVDNNLAAAAAGGRRRKSKKSRKYKKSRKSKKSRKNNKSRKY